jgi:hypothetical protein
LDAVRNFEAFTPSNDPHGEHDFGQVIAETGEAVMWKIDYYDTELEHGSPDPADHTVTQRVMTIFLASEY